MKQSMEIMLPSERIESKILFIRGKKVITDTDLALLYEVETKQLNQAVKRNIERFPEDFMFELTKKESEVLRSQFVTLKSGRGKHPKYLPYVFTEQGIAMLSSVLKSQRAIQVNIQIMRTYIQLREMLATNKYLRDKIEKLEKKYDENFKEVFKIIKKLIAAPSENGKPKSKIGFKTN